jgi:hypothetical protein
LFTRPLVERTVIASSPRVPGLTVIVIVVNRC